MLKEFIVNLFSFIMLYIWLVFTKWVSSFFFVGISTPIDSIWFNLISFIVTVYLFSIISDFLRNIYDAISKGYLNAKRK